MTFLPMSLTPAIPIAWSVTAAKATSVAWTAAEGQAMAGAATSVGTAGAVPPEAWMGHSLLMAQQALLLGCRAF